MISGSRKLPTQHVSIRVPWHDNGWLGTVCNRPDLNTACRVLPRVAEGKDDTLEATLAGQSFADLPGNHLPPCVNERAMFMAPFPLTQTKRHPYVKGNPDLYGHFRETPFTNPAYSAACVPFHWMLSKNAPDYVERYQLDFREDREPDLPFKNNWIQERKNQLVMLDTFFGAIKPDESLCFFYAKDTPLSTSGRRVIVGVGRVASIGRPVEYVYEPQQHNGLRCVLWERSISHSIRGDFADGFLFPYDDVMDVALEQGLDPESFVAYAPDEAFDNFSYGAEHVPHDHAIGAILSCLAALERIAAVHDGPWRRVRQWLDGELNRLWRLRGPFPGFGSALTALLGAGGNLVAYELAAAAAKDSADGNVDPWPEFERVMRAPDEAEGAAADVIGDGFARAWLGMSKERKHLLKLISRFAISAEQATRFFDPDGRPGGVDDPALLANPYLLYELDRDALDPISAQSIDRGALPSTAVLEAHPLPEASRLADRVDHRRVRALVVAVLESAGEQGHTLLPRAWLTERIAQLELDTPCPVGIDVLEGMAGLLEPVVVKVAMADGSSAFQLDRYQGTRSLLRRTVTKRVGVRSKRHAIDLDWRAAVDAELGALPAAGADRDAEEKARSEKAAALKELAQSRLTVLIGAAGTGKTTLLRMLCGIPEVEAGGVLLLAPTGKARVQLETKTGQEGRGMTLAQLLMRFGGRYDPETGAYRVTSNANRCGDYKTVIVDECSMLTEEQLAALIDGLSGVHRLVLVGDHRQLPPIGSGRPFVDIVRHLAPDDIESRTVKVDRGYAELTIPRRQQGVARADLILASWFGGISDPSADEIWDRLGSETMDEIRFESWEDPDELQDKLLAILVEELKLAGRDDQVGFETSLGGDPYNGRCYFWRSKFSDAKLKAEDWQVISPVRAGQPGVDGLNQLIQTTFRQGWLAEATKQHAKPYYRRLNPPLGRHNIIYGDKVINLQNSGRRKVWPDRASSYVANGDVGLVVGSIKTKRRKLYRQLEVEFTSQPSFNYTYWLSEFGEGGSQPLELAYALTVHKTQGSEFGTTFVVIPNPCWLLSRELLYTALTRQQDRVVVLHQGDVRTLRRYAAEAYSDIAQRMTNLFADPNPIEVDLAGKKRFLEDGLIHRTKRGDLVRSKSEVIIANELLAQGIERYAYEQALPLPSGRTFYPDFTLVDDDTGETFYWEHLGLLHNPEYRARWEKKLAAYVAAGIHPLNDDGEGTLIITRDDDGGGIDAQAIAELISQLFGG